VAATKWDSGGRFVGPRRRELAMPWSPRLESGALDSDPIAGSIRLRAGGAGSKGCPAQRRGSSAPGSRSWRYRRQCSGFTPIYAPIIKIVRMQGQPLPRRRTGSKEPGAIKGGETGTGHSPSGGVTPVFWLPPTSRPDALAGEVSASDRPMRSGSANRTRPQAYTRRLADHKMGENCQRHRQPQTDRVIPNE
jgi:hypothetical protein